jgi:hypothetical protein
MTKPLRSLAAAALAASLTIHTPAAAQERLAREETSCAEAKAHILILGTYHMANPGLDAKNLQADDVLLERRQGEIAKLTAALARFRPTKVAVEAPFADREVRAEYKKYLKGEHTLSRNETEQIGFRLAKQMGHAAIYPIDFQMMMSGIHYEEIDWSPKPKPASAAASKEPAKAPELSEDDLLLRRSSVTQYLRRMNEDARIREGHVGYMGLLTPATDGTLYGKSDLLTNWYKRNHRMMANVVRATEPGDRVLLLVGAGHLKILRDLAADAPYLCLVDTQAYLAD